MSDRPSLHVWALRIAKIVSTRGTCARRKVGCVLLDENGFILSTGYNGVATGLIHCTDSPCPGAGYASGEGLDKCEAIHAEANALITCPDPNKVYDVYVTHSPCIHCVKMLLRTPAEGIYFIEPYAHDADARQLWERTDRSRVWKQVSI